MNEEQLNEMGRGVASLPHWIKAAAAPPKRWRSTEYPRHAYGNEGQMFDLMHQARARLIESPSFTGDKILATHSV